IEQFMERLRRVLPEMKRRQAPRLADVRLSLEPGDIVSGVMSMGASAPIEVAVHGPSLPDNERHAEKIRKELAKIESLRDLSYDQALAYPTVQLVLDRAMDGCY